MISSLEDAMALSRRRFFGSSALAAGAALLPPSWLAAAGPAANAADLGDWAAVRGLFQLAPDWVHASLFLLSSHPRPVREAVDELRRRLDANPVDTVEEAAFSPGPHNLGARAASAVARYIGGGPADVALTSSTTQGLALVYHGLGLGPGDEILNTAHEHLVHLVCQALLRRLLLDLLGDLLLEARVDVHHVPTFGHFAIAFLRHPCRTGNECRCR